jgi:putative transposase
MTDVKVELVTNCITIKHCNRGALFYEQADYQYCLVRLGRCVNQYGLFLHAYVLMPDHIYLLLTSVQARPVIYALEQLEADYGDHFNFYHRRTYKLLELDYSMLPIDADQHLLMYCRYIELAPVRAGLFPYPADYSWSSYACNALGEDAGMLTPHAEYLALGADEQSRRSAYRTLFVENQPVQDSDHRAVA